MKDDKIFEINDVSFHYAEAREDERPALDHIDLSSGPGQVILLVGESGSGKTSITQLLNGLIPHYHEGSLEGEVRVAGKRVADCRLYEISRHVGSVFQNPRTQFFTTDTTNELAFACENAGIPTDEIWARINRVCSELSVEDLLDRNIFKLSGGQKQRIACAAASTIDPDLLVLDEPSSNLDMEAIRQLGSIIARWKEQGKTVVIAEHRIFYLCELADCMLLVSDGRIKRRFTGSELRALTNEQLHQMGLRALHLEVGTQLRHQVFEDDGRRAVIENLRFSYRETGGVLDIDRLDVPRRGITTLIGRNGAGKSTFLQCLAGLKKSSTTLKLDSTTVSGSKLADAVYMVFQDVTQQLFAETVLDEIMLSMKEPDKEQATQIAQALNLDDFLDRHPMSLSGGQKQRCAIAGAMASGRGVILYDEPTSGLDLRHMREVAGQIRKLSEAGTCQLIVTHDPEFIEECCTHAIELEGGHTSAPYTLDSKGMARVYSYFASMT